MASRRVWVRKDKAWHKGSLVARNKKTLRVRLDGAAASILVPKRETMPVKHNDKHPKARAEVLPAKATGPRPARFRPTTVRVQALTFTGPGQIGDFGWQLSDKQQANPMFGRALHVYNENMHQQHDKSSNSPGGGNAVARPYRATGESIGMPTGWIGGFRSLDEKCTGPGFSCTAKEAIDSATDQIVAQVCENPDRYDTVFYCTNAEDEHELIGMGIFHIEEATRRYITRKLKELPREITTRERTTRRQMRG